MSHCPICKRACTCKCIIKIRECEFGSEQTLDKQELRQDLDEINEKLAKAKQKNLSLQSTYAALLQTLQNQRAEMHRLKLMHMPSCSKDPQIEEKASLKEELFNLSEEMELAEQDKGKLMKLDNIISSGSTEEFSKWANMVMNTQNSSNAVNELYGAFKKLVLQVPIMRRNMKEYLMK